MDPIAWEPWGRAAFARARAERRPVLLFVGAPWCAATAEMTRTTYADPAVVDLIRERFVAVRVDAERRPDIAERYALGGYPTTAFLAATGAIVGGGTFLTPGRMRDALRRILEAFESLPDTLVHDSPPDTPATVHDSPPDTPATVHDSPPDTPAAVHDSPPDTADLFAVVVAGFDEEHGGFGTAPKFPLTAPIELALVRYRESRDPRLARIVETTLDAMGWGPLYDEIDGGFFRCAAGRDWSEPRREKLLDVNASLLRLYLQASPTLKIARYAERGADIVRYVQTQLADQADGGWAGSQAADARIDWTFYSAANAAMTSAMLQASATLDEPSLGEFALRSLERVLLATYRPGQGVAHYVDDGEPMVRGLLEDQIAMASAQLDACEATGNIVYEMMAQELMHYAMRTMWDETGGGFFDRTMADESECVGLMATRVKPFVANCEAARVLRQLAEVTGDRGFLEKADAALAAVVATAVNHGPLAAHALLAQAQG